MRGSDVVISIKWLIHHRHSQTLRLPAKKETVTTCCLSQCLGGRKKKKHIEQNIRYWRKNTRGSASATTRPHRVLSTVCPWLHEIILTSDVMGKQHWMREEEEERLKDGGGANLNELIEWAKDVCGIQNSNNLGRPCSEECKGGRETKRGKRGTKIKRGRGGGKAANVYVSACEPGEVRFTRVYGLVDFCFFTLKGKSEIPFRYSVNSVGVSLYFTLSPSLSLAPAL